MEDEKNVPQVETSVYRTVGVEVGGKLPSYSSIGGYAIIYYTRREDPVCGECASKWENDCDKIAHAGSYDEGPTLNCTECGCDIESSYGPESDY